MHPRIKKLFLISLALFLSQQPAFALQDSGRQDSPTPAVEAVKSKNISAANSDKEDDREISWQEFASRSNSSCHKVGQIHINGDITSSTGSFVISAIQNLINNGYDEAWLIINSGGGNSYTSINFYHLTRDLPIKLNTYVGSVAQSSAAHFFLSGRERVISRDTFLLFHQSSMTFGTGNGAGNLSDWGMLAKNNDDSVVRILSEVTKSDKSRFTPFMAGVNRHISSREALDFGIATKIGLPPIGKNGAVFVVSGNSKDDSTQINNLTGLAPMC